MKRERLEKLASVYEWSQGVCDPIEFYQRQKMLLHCITKCLLGELDDILEEENPSESLKLFDDLNKEKK
jgi:hypothetical protein